MTYKYEKLRQIKKKVTILNKYKEITISKTMVFDSNQNNHKNLLFFHPWSTKSVLHTENENG